MTEIINLTTLNLSSSNYVGVEESLKRKDFCFSRLPGKYCDKMQNCYKVTKCRNYR